jgi:hypothetical protein
MVSLSVLFNEKKRERMTWLQGWNPGFFSLSLRGCQARLLYFVMRSKNE